jgi:hypothetical protein
MAGTRGFNPLQNFNGLAAILPAEPGIPCQHHHDRDDNV